MTETLNPQLDTAPTSEQNWDDVSGALRSMAGNSETDQPTRDVVETNSNQEIDQPKEPMVSPFGTKLVLAASRINSLLESRLANKADKEQLAENRERSLELQNEAYNTYQPNLTNTKNHEEGLRMNKRFDARAARQEKLDQAKSKVRGFGRSALNKLKDAGLIGLGVTIAGASKSKELATEASQKTKDSIASGIDKAEELAGKAGQKMEGAIESGINTVSSTVEGAKEARNYRREAAVARKEQALNRKYERHAKIMKRRRAIGNFVIRSRVTGQTAVDTWKNYQAK